MEKFVLWWTGEQNWIRACDCPHIAPRSYFANMAAAPAEHHPHWANAVLRFDAGHPVGALAENPAPAHHEHFGP
jgi:hypothetical protein